MIARMRPAVVLIASVIVAAVAGPGGAAMIAAPEAVIWIGLCHGGAMPLPLSGGRGKSPPAGCHAFCSAPRRTARRRARNGGEPR